MKLLPISCLTGINKNKILLFIYAFPRQSLWQMSFFPSSIAYYVRIITSRDWRKIIFIIFHHFALCIKIELMYRLPFSRCNKQRSSIIPVLPEFWNLLYPSDALPFYLRQRPSCVYVCVHGESSLPREYAISSSGLRSTPDTTEIPAAPTPVYCHCDRYCVFTFTVKCADVFKPFCINVTYHLGNLTISFRRLIWRIKD